MEGGWGGREEEVLLPLLVALGGGGDGAPCVGEERDSATVWQEPPRPSDDAALHNTTGFFLLPRKGDRAPATCRSRHYKKRDTFATPPRAHAHPQ